MKMKRKTEDWSVEKLQKERSRFSFPEYQREKSLWRDEKKSMLIDTILKDIDIPKLYFNELRDKEIEVVDGQQRLWSIWEFLDGEYPYQLGSNKKFFSELTAAQQRVIKEYTLQVTLFDEADEDYLRQLFVRLQLGLLLNTGEKLNAATGKMKAFVFNTLVEQQFIKKIGIPERRFAKETLCAQICINSFSREKTKTFSRTRYDDLIQFFEEYADPQGKDLDRFRKQTKEIPAVLEILSDCFGEKAKELKNRSYILSIYLFVEAYSLKKDEEKQFSSFVFLLWKRLKEEAGLGMDRRNRELYSFQSLLSSAPGEQYQIQRRHDKLKVFYDYFKDKKKIVGV
jgi:hypothetical protein